MKTSKKAKHPTMQIVEGIRDGKKVRQRTIAHLGVVKTQEDLKKLKTLADHLIQRLEKEGLKIDPKVEINRLKHTQTVYDGFRMVIDRLMESSGIQKIIRGSQSKRHADLENIVQLLITQRLALPGSKLRAYERQEDYGFQDIELQSIYRAMDALAPLDDAIQKQIFETITQISGGKVDCVFFDVTTLYFESITQDDLKEFGYSKDQKHHSVQIVLALVVDAQGIPLAYETFKGNLAETKTLIPVLEKLRTKFSIDHVTVVCDRGLASQQNISALHEAGFNFVIASKLKSMAKKLQLNTLIDYTVLPGQEDLPKEEQILVRTLPHPQYPDAQLIITYSPARAKKDALDRERLLEKLNSKLTGTSESSIKKVISNGGYKRYTTVKEGSLVTLNERAIEEDMLWDGFHGIAVSNQAQLSTGQALARYRDLWHVEEAFRIAKCTLKTRPIFHWAPHRIKSHVLLCFISLFLERYLERLLREQGTPLTPDRIRYALNQIHTTHFEDTATGHHGQMRSALTSDAETIFRMLKLEVARGTIVNDCCA
jgi:transposase